MAMTSTFCGNTKKQLTIFYYSL